jgi:hypothetical protein
MSFSLAIVIVTLYAGACIMALLTYKVVRV